jgi:ribosomal protein L13E
VRNRFDGRWNRGFTVAEVVDAGYRIRRTSDEQLLPTVFTVDEVRREHRRGQWWY